MMRWREGAQNSLLTATELVAQAGWVVSLFGVSRRRFVEGVCAWKRKKPVSRNTGLKKVVARLRQKRMSLSKHELVRDESFSVYVLVPYLKNENQ